MKLYYNQLAKDLKQALRPVYLLSGDEPLQMMEAGDLICKAAKNADFSEKEVHHVDRGFDWAELYQAANAMSLFAEKKIIDLRLGSCKPGDKGAKALIEYCSAPSTDNILIIRTPKLDRAAQNTKWFKSIESLGAVIQIWPVEIDKLPAWITQRGKSKGLAITPAAVKLLAEKAEGNLLAAAQEIDKLLLTENKFIDVDDLMENIDDAAKYDVFKLAEAALAGQSKRTAKILLGLKASGEEPLFVLWALTNEIRTLMRISSRLSKGDNLPAIFKEERIWDKRQALIKKALPRLKRKFLTSCLEKAKNADQIAKGMQMGNIWDNLLDISLMMSGKSIVKG